MGGNDSKLPNETNDDFRQDLTTAQVPKIRINTPELLAGISNKCQSWLEVINHLKQSTLKDEEVNDYLYQELSDTKVELDIIIKDISSTLLLPPTKHCIPDNGRDEHKTKKTGNFQSPKHDTGIELLQEQLQNKEDENKMYINHTRELTEELLQKKKSFETADNERRETLLRLSQVTGDKLTSNNPNIADLGDPNRPTKLGEMISELYDNEWTDAFEGLQARGRNDRNSIRILFETFMDIFMFCKIKNSRLFALSEGTAKDLLPDTYTTGSIKTGLQRSRSVAILEQSADQSSKIDQEVKQSVENLQSFLYCEWVDKDREKRDPEIEDENDLKEETISAIEEFKKKLKALQDESNKQIHALLKECGEVLTPVIEEDYMKTRWNKFCVKGLKSYIRKCIFIAWMMCVQTPPMAVAEAAKPGDPFNTSLYRQYTAKGPCIDYIVWPAILLHENGPVISKGVAQGKEK